MSHTLQIADSTYDKFLEIRRLLMDFTGDNEERFTDDRIVDFLVDGFLASVEAAHGEDEHGDADGCCGGHCQEDKPKDACCGGHCHC